jgi:general secretion pathway protein J
MTAMERPVRSDIGREIGRQGGFTLLEMLVALIVLGFLIIGLNQGVQTGLGIWRAQARQVGHVAELAPTARVLQSLLAGIPVVPLTNNDRGSPRPISFRGTESRLEFVGDLPNGLGLTQRAEMALVLKDDRLVLSWVPRRRELGGTAQPSSDAELLRGVARLQLDYFNTSAQGVPAGWVARWDAPALPALIRVRLGFAKGDNRHWPDLIVAPRLAAPAG